MRYYAIIFLPLFAYCVLAFCSLAYALLEAPTKLVLKWFALLWVGLLVEIVGTIISPVVVLFANHDTGRLPVGFHWMETHDALLPGYPPEQAFTVPYPKTWWGYYWQSLCWLNRNRVYRFSSEYMGVLCTPSDTRVHIGDYNISDEPPIKVGEFVEWTEKCFEIQKVFIAFGRYWEWRIGYKMAWTVGKTAYAQHVLRLRSGSKVKT